MKIMKEEYGKKSLQEWLEQKLMLEFEERYGNAKGILQYNQIRKSS